MPGSFLDNLSYIDLTLSAGGVDNATMVLACYQFPGPCVQYVSAWLRR